MYVLTWCEEGEKREFRCLLDGKCKFYRVLGNSGKLEVVSVWNKFGGCAMKIVQALSKGCLCLRLKPNGEKFKCTFNLTGGQQNGQFIVKEGSSNLSVCNITQPKNKIDILTLLHSQNKHELQYKDRLIDIRNIQSLSAFVKDELKLKLPEELIFPLKISFKMKQNTSKDKNCKPLNVKRSKNYIVAIIKNGKVLKITSFPTQMIGLQDATDISNGIFGLHIVEPCTSTVNVADLPGIRKDNTNPVCDGKREYFDAVPAILYSDKNNKAVQLTKKKENKEMKLLVEAKKPEKMTKKDKVQIVKTTEVQSKGLEADDFKKSRFTVCDEFRGKRRQKKRRNREMTHLKEKTNEEKKQDQSPNFKKQQNVKKMQSSLSGKKESAAQDEKAARQRAKEDKKRMAKQREKEKRALRLSFRSPRTLMEYV